MKAIIRKTKNQQFRFNLIGENGEPIATSETYTNKAKAKKTIFVYFPDAEVEDWTRKPGVKLNMILPPKTRKA